MTKFVQGVDRDQAYLSGKLDDMIARDNTVRAIDDYVESLDLHRLGLHDEEPASEQGHSYHPADLLKLLVYGHCHHIQLSRQLAREAQRNIEVMWLLKQVTPDFKTISDFRLAKSEKVHDLCHQFVRGLATNPAYSTISKLNE